jgi:hypothetical protein
MKLCVSIVNNGNAENTDNLLAPSDCPAEHRWSTRASSMDNPLSTKSPHPVRALDSLSAKRIHTDSVSCQPSSMVPASRLCPLDTDQTRSGRRRFLLGEDSSEWCGQVRGNMDLAGTGWICRGFEDVVQCTRCINASLSCHGKGRITNEKR